MTTNIFCFYLQNRLIQTSQTGGQWYSDPSHFSILWIIVSDACTMNTRNDASRSVNEASGSVNDASGSVNDASGSVYDASKSANDAPRSIFGDSLVMLQMLASLLIVMIIKCL